MSHTLVTWNSRTLESHSKTYYVCAMKSVVQTPFVVLPSTWCTEYWICVDSRHASRVIEMRLLFPRKWCIFRFFKFICCPVPIFVTNGNAWWEMLEETLLRIYRGDVEVTLYRVRLMWTVFEKPALAPPLRLLYVDQLVNGLQEN